MLSWPSKLLRTRRPLYLFCSVHRGSLYLDLLAAQGSTARHLQAFVSNISPPKVQWTPETSVRLSERGGERGLHVLENYGSAASLRAALERSAETDNFHVWDGQNASDNTSLRPYNGGPLQRYASLWKQDHFRTPHRPAIEIFSSLVQRSRLDYRSFSRIVQRIRAKDSLRTRTHKQNPKLLRIRESRLALRAKESALAKGKGHFRDKLISLRTFSLVDTREDGLLEAQRGLESFVTSWNINFARVHNHFTRMAQAKLLSNQSKQEGQHEVSGTVRILHKWSQAGGYERALLKLISALHWNPEEALLRLEKNLVNNGALLPQYVSKDSLQHLACVWLLDVDVPTPSSVAALHRIACEHLRIYGQKLGRASLSQLTVYLLSKHCSADQLLSFVQCLQEHEAHLTANTKLHVITRLTDQGRIGSALSLLQSIPYGKLTPFGQQNVLRVSIKLLRAEFEVDDLYGLRSSILAYLLKYGIRPDRTLTNVVILNAMEACDYNTAWRSHEIAMENGLRPDQFTYTALLKNAQYKGSRGKIEVVYAWARDDGTLEKRPRVRFELLYAMYIAQGQGRHALPFSTLLPRFGEFYEIQSLQDIGILESNQVGSMLLPDVSSSEDPHIAWGGNTSLKAHITPVQPPRQAVGLMILAWLRERFDHEKAAEAYKRYMQHIRNGHPVIAQLAGTTHTANAFILAFAKDRHTLSLCTQVVQDMLKPEGVSDMQSSETSDPSSAPLSYYMAGNSLGKIAPPDAQTWNILVYAFTRNHQAEAAEKVLKIMESRGVKRDKVTWNTLLSGYAKMQDVDGSVRTLSRMEGSGVLSDQWTKKALGWVKVKDRAALIDKFGSALRKVARLEGTDQQQRT